jgi:hypothetical protein
MSMIGQKFHNDKRWLTQRAADKWESARFTGFFLALSLYCSQAESQPAHLRLTQAVSLPNLDQSEEMGTIKK